MTSKIEREIVDVPAQTADRLRQAFGVHDGPLRMTYVTGPGNVVCTYGFWRDGKPDPGVPSVTYSSQMYELARQAGIDLQVVTTFPPPDTTTPGIRFAQVSRQPWTGRLTYYRSQALYARAVTRAVSGFDPHVVLADLDFPSSGWGALKQGRRLILAAHNTFWPMGQPPTSLKARARMHLLRRRSTLLDGAVCTSHECARQLSTLTDGRISGRVHHPQIVSRYPVETRTRMRRMLYLGRIERAKGIFMLLEAFTALKQRFGDLDLTFAGSGSYDDALHAAIAAADVPDVRFLGRLGATDVHREIAATDLIICPTLSSFPEGLAVVGLEGAAHGIPTLQSSIVPAVDLLGDACKVFTVDDAEDLKRALTELITDNSLYQELIGALDEVRPRLYDASLSWGSQVLRVLLDQNGRP